MHDYQLERLNTRSFEQLVQALGLEIIGKQLMIFGDGPDGGREATFEGTVKYPEGKQPWNGYGILQAKFRQIPDSVAGKNADWAITQLKDEFKKFKPRTKQKTKTDSIDRICPEYYVFATNLSLSSVAKKGGKDRVSTLLDGFKKSHGLKHYAVWDGDQIRRFLDTQPSIRTTYLAWLLPGDVLGEIVKLLELNRADFPSTVRRYLESQLLDDQFAKLGQGGYTDANAIPLSNVFVDLPIKLPDAESLNLRENEQRGLWVNRTIPDDPGVKGEQRPTFLELFFEEGRKVLKPSANPIQNGRAQKAAGRVVLIGGPGQGKTTVGLFTCQLLRAALLRACSAIYSPEVTQALEIIAQQSQDLPEIHALRYPLRVDLKKLAEALAGEGDLAANSLLDYLVKHISKRTDSELSKADFRTWLKSYPWLLVLDGLDEVPASSNRSEMMDAIRDFVSVEAYQQDADLLILATTRPQGYSDEFDPALYRHLPLAPLSATEALKYGTKLAGARHNGFTTRVEELISSLSRATTNPATVRLMESPLQVTIMLALIEGGGEPPEQRWKLFHDYYDVIYRREKERGTTFSSLLGSFEPDIHWLHHRAGWLLQQRNAGAGSTAARLTHDEFEALVEARLLKRGHTDIKKRGELTKQILEAATDRLVFLVGNTANEIGFEIRSLQEFMAAEHCFDGSEASVQETLRAIAPYPYWRNVLLFVAGRIFFEKESLIDSLIAMCERLNEPLNDAAQGFIAAGSRLALAILKDGAVRNQPENSRVLARCAARLLDLKDSEQVTDLLAQFGGDADDVWKNELETRLMTTGAQFPHLAWRLCLELAVAGNKWAEQIMREKFPCQDAAVCMFLEGLIENNLKIPRAFRTLFEANILTYSPDIWILFSRIDEFLKDIKSVQLQQLSSIFNKKIHPTDMIRLVEDSLQETCNGLSRTTNIEPWSAFKVPDTSNNDVHPKWRTYHAVSEFCRDLTPINLARQLHTILENDPSLDADASRVFPWQIHACMVARDSGMPEVEIIAAVATGAIGDAKNWADWASPNRKSIKLSQLGFNAGLLSASDNHQGAVFGNAGWQHFHGSSENFKFAKALTKALPALTPGSPITNGLINLCCFGLRSAHLDWQKSEQAVVEDFLKSCQKLNIPVTREIISAVVGSSLENASKIELLATIGFRIAPRSWLHNWDRDAATVNTSCEQLLTALNSHSQKADVLAALSRLPPLQFATNIPANLLDFCSHLDEPHRQAAIALKSNSLEWDLDAAESLARDIFCLRKQYPHHLGELMESIESKGASGPHLEVFLLALMKSPNLDTDTRSQSQIASLLVKLVERRPAINSLPDPAASKTVAN